MNKNELINNLADKHNFDEAYVISPEEFTQYKIDTQKHGINYEVNPNPLDIMDDVKCIIVLISKYNPYDISCFTNDHAIVDAYYIASNKSYANARVCLMIS